jgi:hypothetical protein
MASHISFAIRPTVQTNISQEAHASSSHSTARKRIASGCSCCPANKTCSPKVSQATMDSHTILSNLRLAPGELNLLLESCPLLSNTESSSADEYSEPERQEMAKDELNGFEDFFEILMTAKWPGNGELMSDQTQRTSNRFTGPREQSARSNL